MKRLILAAWLTVGLGAAGGAAAAPAPEASATDAPQKVIANDALVLSVYLPDAEKGFYRGTRFDWSGLVARALFGRRTVYAPFRERYDPLNHDNVCGPAEEFDMDRPQGYDEAKPGESFVKIGVGLLEKPEEDKYQFSKRYRFLRPPAWKVANGKDWVRFEQTLAGDRGWGYVYTKRVSLSPGAPGFVISHTLRNTGAKAIDTVTYNHNFTQIDREPVGPLYRVAFPFDLVSKQVRGRVEMKGRELVFPEVLAGGSVWIAFEGADRPAREHFVSIENRRTGTGVWIQGDRPVAEWRFYAEKTAACPEPFIRIQVAPGAEETWETRYTFLTGSGQP